MTITTYQIRNVLKVYGNQLKKRANLLDASIEPVQPSSDFVDISVEARRKQVLSQLSHKIISELQKEPPEKGAYAKELQIRRGIESRDSDID
ncbi:MAG: hypothetical protein DRH12_14540 [Deltaproteobacteria bacterium]|nr:MAG: hypothetical protein DRH12_14540 [Deltaproteobacteria bacterium]RLB86272.1 MAG: hypothetical protein DRH15_01980 [Deltaproteobacteria bacterium]